MNRFQKGLLIAGAVLVLAMGLLSRGLNKPPPPPEEGQRPAAQPVTALTKAGVGSAIPRRKAKIEPAEPPERTFDPYEEWELTKIFDNFMVPPGRFEAANMRAAVDELGIIYGIHGGKRGLSFHQRTSFDPNLAIAFDHGNISFRQLLGIMAAHGNCNAEVSDEGIAFTPFDIGTGSEVGLRVPPHFTSTTPVPVVIEPTTGEILELGERDHRRSFEEYGIIFSDEVEIVADPRTSTWSVTGDPAEVARVKSVIESIGQAPQQQQVFITQKFIKVENGITFEPQTYATDAEFQLAIQEMNQMEGVNIVSAPSVVTRAGQRAKVEIIREVIYPTATDANGEPSAFDMQPVGFSVETNAILAGLDRIQLSGSSDLTTVGDQRLGDALNVLNTDPPQAQSEDDFARHITDFEGQLIEGNTAFVEAAQEDGTTVYQFIHAQRTDPAGVPLLPDN